MYYQVDFKIKVVSASKSRIIELLFKDWVDSICDNQVEYEIRPSIYGASVHVRCSNSEDAMAIRLRGLPSEFDKLIKIVN